MDYKRKDLEEDICGVFGLKAITPIISKHINKYILQDGMTYKEIGRCVVWYGEVAKLKYSPVYGLAFVPNVREEADKYFRQLELDQQQQATEATKVVEYQDNNIIFSIKAIPHHKRMPKHIDIDSINIEGDNNGDY